MNAVTRFLKLSAATALLGGLCACASVDALTTPTSTAIDRNSPAAAEVARLASQPTTFPTFAEIPPAPTDVRTPQQWRESVLSLQAVGAALVRDTDESTFTLRDTDAWAASVSAGLDARAARPVSDAERAESEAFVKAAKARATPPPRPH